MKISNETKIGALAAVSIAVLILGFNYLKGKELFDKNTRLFAVFNKVDGLAVSNPVLVNGMQVGKVASVHETDLNLTGVVVTIDLLKDYRIPTTLVSTDSPFTTFPPFL